MSNKKSELLAPAGDLKKLKTAFLFGADAVYCGLPTYSLRAKTGFSMADLKKGVEYAHKLGKKVYVTINIFAHNYHLKKLPAYLRELKKIKPDGIIASDFGVINLVKKYLPKTEIHISTQANTLNYEAVKFWRRQGVKRIILGREATLQDIKEIHRQVPKMELEVFVHGAMCMSYSGRCYLSAWLNNRSANQGLCTQPCRWNYRVFLEEPLRPQMMIPVSQDKNGTYILNSRDLCLVKYLTDLQKAGVTVFKIEGRTKSLYYLASITRVYRQVLDGVMNVKTAKQELQKIDNRNYTTGFLLGQDKDIQEFKTSKAVSDWEFVGRAVKNYKSKVKDQRLFLEVHNVLKTADEVEIVTPQNVYKVKIKQLFNVKGEKIQAAHGGTKKIFNFKLDNDYDIVEGSIIRKLKI